MREGLRNATFSRQDLFKVNYSNYDNVVIFGVNEMVNFPAILPSIFFLITCHVSPADARAGSLVPKVTQAQQPHHCLQISSSSFWTFSHHRRRNRYCLGLSDEMKHIYVTVLNSHFMKNNTHKNLLWFFFFMFLFQFSLVYIRGHCFKIIPKTYYKLIHCW